MSRVTAFVGAYGYGNLGDELCLIEAMERFPCERAYAFSVHPDWTRRCVPKLAGCFRDAGEMLALEPDRIVFGGGHFGTPRAFAAWIPPMGEAADRGAELHVHNIGAGGRRADMGWLDDRCRGIFARLATFTVRDYASFEWAAVMPFGRLPGITFYPETEVAAEHDLAAELLPPGGPKLLGVSMIPTPLMNASLEHDAARVRAVLEEFADHAVVPIVSTIHCDSEAENDGEGVLGFVNTFLPDAAIAGLALLDREFWLAEMTPRRLKGIIARCDVLLTQRKHNAVHAIGAGTRVIGLHPMVDESLRRTFVTLGHRLKPGSRCVGLDHPPGAL